MSESWQPPDSKAPAGAGTPDLFPPEGYFPPAPPMAPVGQAAHGTAVFTDPEAPGYPPLSAARAASSPMGPATTAAQGAGEWRSEAGGAVLHPRSALDVLRAQRFRDWTILTVEKNRSGRDAVDLEFEKHFEYSCFDATGRQVQEKLIEERLYNDS